MINCCKLDDPFGDDVGPLIKKVIKLWLRITQKCLDDLNLTPTQLELLGAIAQLTKEGKTITQIALSQETNIDPMTTSTILRNLQKRGLINRTESKTDTRAREIELTELGIETFLKALERIKVLYNKLFEDEESKLTLKKRLLATQERLNKINDQL